jgi:hypothetical protein
MIVNIQYLRSNFKLKLLHLENQRRTYEKEQIFNAIINGSTSYRVRQKGYTSE